MTDPETQIATWFATYDAPIARLGKALRAKLRARLPGLTELVYVYERQGSLVFSYSPTEAGAGGVAGVAVYPDRVNLFLNGGPALSKADPGKLLRGSGKAVRYVEVDAIEAFDRPEIETLIAAALDAAKVRLDPKAKGAVVLKADEQKQRAARAKRTAGAASARPKAERPKKPAR